MNKGRRNELRKLKYIKRIRKQANQTDIYIARDGSRVDNPKTIDILKDGGYNCYRDQSTPCSCSMCAYLKYDRAKEKRKWKI